MDMLKRNVSGSNLIEYIIPVAVVGVVMGIGIYTMSGSGVLQKFFLASSGGQVDNDGIAIFKSSNYASSNSQGYNLGNLAQLNSIQLNTTGSLQDLINSIKSPVNSTAVLQEASNFVETSGSAGNVNQIGNIISVLASKMATESSENPSDPTLAQLTALLQQMSNKTVYNSGLAESQKKLETQVNQSKGNHDVAVPLPPDIQSMIASNPSAYMAAAQYASMNGYDSSSILNEIANQVMSEYYNQYNPDTMISGYMSSLTPTTDEMNTQLGDINAIHQQFKDLAATDEKYKELADKVDLLIGDVNSLNSNLINQANNVQVNGTDFGYTINICGIEIPLSQVTDEKGQTLGNGG